MQLSAENRQQVFEQRGIWVREACDHCGKIITTSYVWTRQGQPEVYC